MIFSSFNSMNFLTASFIFVNLMIFNFFLTNFIKSKFILFKIMVLNFIENEFNKINNSLISTKLLIIIFMYNLIINLNDLIPFSYCFNAQLNYFFFFSLILWFSCILFNLKFLMKELFIHFTPFGCPTILSFFMVMIEFISLCIRPITLSVRMSANLIAGHLMIHLISEFSFFLMIKNYFNLIFSLMLMIAMNLLEIGVSMIQPYIFCSLMNMYLNEIK